MFTCGINCCFFSVPSNIVKACVSDNVFNSDFSSRNCYPVANMAITNYYSHKKITSNDITMFSVNKRAKENYICANCKMKFSYFTKKESKSPQSDYSQANNNNINININNNINNNNINNSNSSLRSDITVLKQTLSYPDISDDTIPPNTIIQDQTISLPNCPRKRYQPSLKRHRKEHSNHVVIEKKPKVTSPEPIISPISSHKPEELPKESSDLPTLNEIVSNEQIILESVPETKIISEKIEIVDCETVKVEPEIVENNPDEPEDKQEPQNYEEYRSMPLSLSTLNYVSEDFLNRECPKPKKIWMKMIENEDIEKLTVDPPEPVPLMELTQSEQIPPKPVITQSKIRHRHNNRSYKIKQTLHDKVILTVEKRPDKYKTEPLPPKSVVSDIYTFSEESEILADMQGLIDCLMPKPIVEDDRSAPLTTVVAAEAVAAVVESKTDDSIKSSNSSSSKTSRKSKISKKNSVLLNDQLTQLHKSVPENRSNVKMEPDSTSDAIDSLFPESGLVSSAISTCESSSGTAFSLNDIVWAKITGYPFWPAKIISFSQQDDVFVGCIEWYAWNEISFIKVNNLFHFLAYYPSKYQKRNRNGKYQEAVKLAKFDCGMIDLPGSKATSEDNENASSVKGGGSETDSDSNAASCTSVSI